MLKDLALNSREVSSIGVAVEETRDTVAGHLSYSGEQIFPYVADPFWCSRFRC